MILAGALTAALLVPRGSRAQTAPPPVESTPPAPAPASLPTARQDPLAGWRVAPSYTRRPGAGSRTPQSTPLPAQGAYPTYGAAWQPTQRSFVPPRMVLRSPGAIVGGTVLAVAGVLPLLGGIAGIAKGDGPPVPEISAVAIVGGLHFIGGGIALVAWGSRDRWVRGEASAAPVVRVGATSASAHWAF